jgi:deoxyxylulose-5-phosphate synthase
MTIADAVHERCNGGEHPRVEILGVPTGFLPHAKPDRILSALGLDADGLVAAVRRHLG